jgi:hypothetical protein
MNRSVCGGWDIRKMKVETPENVSLEYSMDVLATAKMFIF